MTTRYITQVFENTDYNPVMVTEYITVTDPVTFETTTQTVERPQALTAEQIALAQSNLNYRRAVLLVEHLCALGLASTLSLNSITMRLNGGSSMIEVNE